MLVWNELAISDPHEPAGPAGHREDRRRPISRDLKRPLKAAETYLELNFIRGGSDAAIAGGRLPDRHVAEEREALGRGPARAGDVRRQLPAACPGRPGPDHDRPDPPDQPGLGGRHQGLPPRDRRIQGRPMGAGGQVVDRRVHDQSQPVAGSDGGLPRLRGGLSRKTPSWPRPTAASRSSRTWPASRSWSTRRASGRPSTPSSRSPRSSARNWPTRSRASSSIARW